jgi:hypothetical protein
MQDQDRSENSFLCAKCENKKDNGILNNTITQSFLFLFFLFCILFPLMYRSSDEVETPRENIDYLKDMKFRESLTEPKHIHESDQKMTGEEIIINLTSEEKNINTQPIATIHPKVQETVESSSKTITYLEPVNNKISKNYKFNPNLETVQEYNQALEVKYIKII